MPKRTSDYRTALLEDLRSPKEAALYLTEALRDSEEMFLSALRDVAEAKQMSKVAEGAGIARESIYRMLSPSGNPTYRNLLGIFRVLGVEFSQVRSRSDDTTRGPNPFEPYRPPIGGTERTPPPSPVMASRFHTQSFMHIFGHELRRGDKRRPKRRVRLTRKPSVTHEIKNVAQYAA